MQIKMSQNKSHSSLSDLIEFLKQYVEVHHGCSKEELAAATSEHFSLTKRRAVYCAPHFAIRFSEASGKSFANTVISLSTLRRYDSRPFVVCVVRPSGIQLLLSNSTFLKKLSHTSQRFRADNVRGSFLGHDILRMYDEIENKPENFSRLFPIHLEFSWEENVQRLVETTSNIAPTGTLFRPTDLERENILVSADIAHSLSHHPEYMDLAVRLREIVKVNETAILKAGKVDNIHRGDAIEQIITNAGNFHSVEDISFVLNIGNTVLVDIKTKILSKSSSPKLYNIDKVLRNLAVRGTVFSLFFVGLDLQAETTFTCLVSILDQNILNATKFQYHWAGRNSRGATQLTGDLSAFFEADFRENIQIGNARAFLQSLMNREAQ